MIAIFSLYFYALHKIAGVILLSRSTAMRVDARSCMNVFGKVIASIIDDGRCGMSDVVAFRTAPPIGGLSC